MPVGSKHLCFYVIPNSITQKVSDFSTSQLFQQQFIKKVYEIEIHYCFFIKIILTLTSPVLLDSSLAFSLWLAASETAVVSPLLWRPLESEEAEPLENAAPEDVERVMRGSKDPLDDEVASGDLGGCLALKGLVDLERLESKFRPTLEARDPRLK